MSDTVWRAGDIVIEVDDRLTDDPIVTATIATPVGHLRMMAEVQFDEATLRLTGLHLHGEDVGPREFGSGNLRRLADAVMEVLECDEIVREGAVRQSGANPGRAPRTLRFKRRLRAGIAA